MRKIGLLLIMASMILMVNCTDNTRTRVFGGSETIKLPEGQMLINATWKEADIWYLTQDMPVGHVPRQINFTEKSQFGILSGGVTFVESRGEHLKDTVIIR